MSKKEIYAAFDEIIALEASGNFAAASKRIRSINRRASHDARKSIIKV